MSGGETHEFYVGITLSTVEGELPTPQEVEMLVYDQMSGCLDDGTEWADSGRELECLGVSLIEEISEDNVNILVRALEFAATWIHNARPGSNQEMIERARALARRLGDCGTPLAIRRDQ